MSALSRADLGDVAGELLERAPRAVEVAGQAELVRPGSSEGFAALTVIRARPCSPHRAMQEIGLFCRQGAA